MSPPAVLRYFVLAISALTAVAVTPVQVAANPDDADTTLNPVLVRPGGVNDTLEILFDNDHDLVFGPSRHARGVSCGGGSTCQVNCNNCLSCSTDRKKCTKCADNYYLESGKCQPLCEAITCPKFTFGNLEPGVSPCITETGVCQSKLPRGSTRGSPKPTFIKYSNKAYCVYPYVRKDTVCRASQGPCDVPEVCDGQVCVHTGRAGPVFRVTYGP